MNQDEFDEYEELSSAAKKKRRLERILKELKQRHDTHTGEWITFEDAKEYRDRAEKLPNNGRQDIGERRPCGLNFKSDLGLQRWRHSILSTAFI